MLKEKNKTIFKRLLNTAAVAIAAVLLLSTDVKAQADEISDLEIKRALRAEYITSEVVSAHLIDINVMDGVVDLEGSVSNLLEEERAVRIAESIKGVRSVIENLVVVPVAVSDDVIKSNIKDALAWDQATEDYNIDVIVEDGKVTLHGDVNSKYARKYVAKVVKGITGVRAIDNKIEYTYDRNREAEEMKAEIKRKLLLDPYINSILLNVKVDDNTAIITGEVGSAAEKREVFESAFIAGITAVNVDAVKVNPWLKEEMKKQKEPVLAGKQEIKNALTDAYEFSDLIDHDNINIEVDQGIVTLTGKTGNLAAVNEAEKIAESTAGVQGVNNYLIVKLDDVVKDAELSTRISNVLAWDPVLERHELDVTVRNSKVYLSGSVDYDYEKMHAAKIVSSVEGVASLVNNIKVDQEWTFKSDSDIKSEIEDNLYWSTKVDGKNIAVEVNDGVAVLTGEVNNYAEFQHAVFNAVKAGPRAIKSDINITDTPDPTPEYYIPYNQFINWRLD